MTENSLAEEAQLTLALRKAYLTFHRRANAALLSYGVTADQYVVLSLLRSQKGVTQKWVVDQTGSDPNTVSRLVSTLESKQLLSRQRDPDDGRAYVVKLTSKGSSLVRKTAETATLCASSGTFR